MTRLKVNHINLPVKDLARSIDFYQDLLGFELIKYFSNSEGEKVKAVMEFEGFDFFLEKADGFGESATNFHFGLKSDLVSLRVLEERLTRQGVHVGLGLRENPPSSSTHRFYFKDPDGYTIEAYDEP